MNSLPAHIETRAYRGDDVELIVSDWIRDREVERIAKRYGITRRDEGYVLMVSAEAYESLADELWPWTIEGVERTS